MKDETGIDTVLSLELAKYGKSCPMCVDVIRMRDHCLLLRGDRLTVGVNREYGREELKAVKEVHFNIN